MVDLNFSQYSSRYDKFKNGIILPAFDYKMAGGALMDLGIYNINFVVGLFGEAKKVIYYPNIKRKVDTSGLLVLDYGKFKVNSINAKDCKAPLNVCIQGDKAHIKSCESSSVLNTVCVVDNKRRCARKVGVCPGIGQYMHCNTYRLKASVFGMLHSLLKKVPVWAADQAVLV